MIISSLISLGLAAEQELFLVIEFLYSLELCFFGPIWDVAVAWAREETARTHTLLYEKRRGAHLKEVVRCCVEVVHLLPGEVTLDFCLASCH